MTCQTAAESPYLMRAACQPLWWIACETSALVSPSTNDAPSPRALRPRGTRALPLGAPTDAATVAAVIDTVRHNFAGNNAGERWCPLDLYSGDVVQQYDPIFVGEPPADLRAFVETPPAPVP